MADVAALITALDRHTRAMAQEHHLRQQEVKIHSRLMKLMTIALPKVWGMPELREHWPGWSDQRIKAAAADICSYRGTRGQRFALTLEQVMAIDEAMDT
jgi:hypothetical protein